jgi:hypothetical protein
LNLQVLTKTPDPGPGNVSPSRSQAPKRESVYDRNQRPPQTERTNASTQPETVTQGIIETSRSPQ